VRILWQVTAGANPTFSMSWQEDGGPKVEAPARKGFGQIVIGRMAEAAVQGVAEIAFQENGLVWRLRAAAEYVLAPSLGGK
jgi:two-component sensor histidine kinase